MDAAAFAPSARARLASKIELVVVLVLVLAAIAFWWLLVDARPGDATAQPLHIADLRAAAAQLAGPAPHAVEAEVVAQRRQQGDILSAGSGLKRRPVVKMAFRLPVSHGGAVVIDTGLTPAQASADGFQHYDEAAQRRIDAAMNDASLILLTHEHDDHVGGLLALAARQSGRSTSSLLAKARFNPAQLPHSPLAAALAWPGGAAPRARIAASGVQAVAPGIVVIPAPSHTPGSQLIYVRLASGGEYLFAGDIATMESSWRELRPRSRLVEYFVAPEDRRAVFSWLITIRQLVAEDPALIVVPGHDAGWLVAAERGGWVANGFGHDR